MLVSINLKMGLKMEIFSKKIAVACLIEIFLNNN